MNSTKEKFWVIAISIFLWTVVLGLSSIKAEVQEVTPDYPKPYSATFSFECRPGSTFVLNIPGQDVATVGVILNYLYGDLTATEVERHIRSSYPDAKQLVTDFVATCVGQVA